MVIVDPAFNTSMVVEIETRCRECPSCLRVRRNLWAHRAATEARLWPRTWFGTITLRPDAHYLMLAQARREFAPNGDFDTLGEIERFRLVDRQIWRELAKMWKRIRKNYGFPLRYFIVAEAHKSGYPHYHCLVHQVQEAAPLKYTSLEGQWPHGFTKWRLVKSVAEARYTAKYCSKSVLARVRASQRYGETGLAAIPYGIGVLPEDSEGYDTQKDERLNPLDE